MYYHWYMVGKRAMPKTSDILSASEIGQYVFCSCAWQLRRLGYEPESPFLETGKYAHVALGEQIESLKRITRISRWCAGIGILILSVTMLLFFIGVIR
jgi:hypothetical protein